MLLRGTCSLICIGFALWLALHWSGYAETHVREAGGWRAGGVSMVEITLVEADREKLACASDAVAAGLRCAYQANGAPRVEPLAHDQRLSPYGTVRKQLLLGAGLWSQPALRGPLPAQRFTVVCNFHMDGVFRSASVRWDVGLPFEPLQESVAVGRLSECVIPP